jgi:hypothetical protein
MSLRNLTDAIDTLGNLQLTFTAREVSLSYGVPQERGAAFDYGFEFIAFQTSLGQRGWVFPLEVAPSAELWSKVCPQPGAASGLARSGIRIIAH